MEIQKIESAKTTARGKNWTIDARVEMGPKSREFALKSGLDGFDYVGKSPRGTCAVFCREARTGKFRFVLILGGQK